MRRSKTPTGQGGCGGRGQYAARQNCSVEKSIVDCSPSKKCTSKLQRVRAFQQRTSVCTETTGSCVATDLSPATRRSSLPPYLPQTAWGHAAAWSRWRRTDSTRGCQGQRVPSPVVELDVHVVVLAESAHRDAFAPRSLLSRYIWRDVRSDRTGFYFGFGDGLWLSTACWSAS